MVSGIEENEDKHKEDDTGTEQRLNDHVLKVAMLLQLAEDKDNLIISSRMSRKLWNYYWILLVIASVI